MLTACDITVWPAYECAGRAVASSVCDRESSGCCGGTVYPGCQPWLRPVLQSGAAFAGTVTIALGVPVQLFGHAGRSILGGAGFAQSGCVPIQGFSASRTSHD